MLWRSKVEDGLPDSPVAIPNAIWQILFTRGIRSSEDIELHLHPKLKNLSHPFSLDQMKEATDRLVEAFRKGEKVAIYGDYDLDGTPGVSLLKHGFDALGFKGVVPDQPLRLADGYGVHKHKVDKLKEQGVSLIVTVDVGITDVEAIAHAKTLGIDTIVTDHHLPKEVLPDAVAIVNPNKGFCGSGLTQLCGTGVAFYLILALKMALKEAGLLQNDFNPKELLDLFAIATITDMVPLTKENRILVKHGLKELSTTKRPGIKALMQSLGIYGRPLDSFDISFKLAPKLNALSRLEEGPRALDVFLAGDDTAFEVVEEILAVNERRQQYQKVALAEAERILKEDPTKEFIWVYSDQFHPGVVSLVANAMMKKYGVPAMVGAVKPNGTITGSGRAPKSHNLQTVFGGVSEHLHKFGGHAQAAGFETSLELAGKLQSQLREYFVDVHTEGVMKSLNDKNTPEEVYDAEIELKDLTPQFMNWFEALGPFGMGFEAPVFIMRNLRVKKLRALKRKKFKYTLTDQEGYRELEAPWFDSPKEIPEGSRVDILFEPQWNDYMGRRTLQGLIKTMRVLDEP